MSARSAKPQICTGAGTGAVVVNLRRIVASLSQHRSSEPGEGSGFSGTAQGWS